MKYNWIIDKNHSQVRFSVKYLLISKITGYFKVFNSRFKSAQEDSFSEATVDFTISIQSIDTFSQQRDEHLISKDFFDAEKFPTMHFQSTSFVKKTANSYRLTGNLTIKSIKKSTIFDATFNGSTKDLEGNLKIGFEVHSVISRKDFGLSWNNVTEAGAATVDDAIDITLSLVFIKE